MDSIGESLILKEGDIVLVKSRSIPAAAPFHLKLIKREEVPEFQGSRFKWPGYSGWHGVLIYQHEVDILNKQWHVFIKNINEDLTFIYDDDILKKIKKEKK